MHEGISWGSFDDEFADELARVIAGRRVLEVFAGNGLLAAKLAGRGVDIVATTLFAGHDGHDQGMHHPVIEMDASEAVEMLGGDRDVLLMSWPTTTEAAARAAIAWGSDRDIVFIGEAWDLSLDDGGLPGCASDLFFAITDREGDFAQYRGRNDLDRALVLRLSPERLEVERQKPDFALNRPAFRMEW